MSDSVPGRTTEFGFQWGAAMIQRLFSDVKKGWVTVGVETPKCKLQVYITKTGKIRVHSDEGEWILVPRKK